MKKRNKTMNNTYYQKGKFTEEPWELINSYFRNEYLQRLVRHQLESFNELTKNQLERTIEMFNPIEIRSENDYSAVFKKYGLEITIEFENFSIFRPQIHENNGATKIMIPQEARLRNFTYASTMTVDLKITYLIRNGEELKNEQRIMKKIPRIHIGKLPIMLKSDICVLRQYQHINNNITGECRFDPGGYFIINGSEKTVLGQERAAENKIYCFDVSKNTSKWNTIAEIKSVPDYKQISPKQINLMVSSKNNGFGYPIYIQIPRIKNPIPLFIVFRALGIISDFEICSFILLSVNDESNKKFLYALKASIIDANNNNTQESAMEYVTNNVMYTPINMSIEAGKIKKREFTNDVLHQDLFPHCHNLKQKIYFLGNMTHKLLRVSLKMSPVDDRDSYLNKRIDSCGVLINNLFRNYLNKVVKDMQKQIVREINNGSWRSTSDYENIINLTNIYKIIKSSTIENGIKRALATGDFGIKHISTSKVGVAQVLSRLTYVSGISHSRRINTPIDKSGKLTPPRKLHNTTWGYLCPAETPEGQSVGVVKNLSYMTHLTITSSSSGLYDYVNDDIVHIEDITPIELFNKVKVIINGTIIGYAKEPYDLYLKLKDKKYKGIINIYTGIVFDYNNKEIVICNDAGRLTRPLLKIKDKRLLLTPDIVNKIKSYEFSWDDLLTNIKVEDSVIEYIDPAEQNSSLIAMRPYELVDPKNKLNPYTHCEIHPSTIFGILASCIPFPETNQSPRNTYQCAMGKQAMGIYVSNFKDRMDKTAYVLTYPMRPLVDTRVMSMIQLNNIPSGSPVMVAIATTTGYNQEDSVLVNKGSLDRGLFQATIYHTEKDEDKKIHGDQEIRCKPDPSKTKGMKFANYDKINKDGVVDENTLLEDKDIIIAKMFPIKENRNDHTKIIKYEDQSKIIRTHEETYVDKNYMQRNGEGYNLCKSKNRALRKPVIGDKMSSRHGQKGTIGNIIPECDMPFTQNGIKPDIIINPHAIPSRMTIAQLKETILGKILVELGLYGDGTSFGDLEISEICNKLQDIGYESRGNELMYDGLTGKQIECSIFIGPVFYQRLKHMVTDKQHSRSIGPMVNLTRQPAEGRSRDGGLRFGEMERDCCISHGISEFTKERIYNASDKYSVHICKSCGFIASYNNKMNIHYCRTCENRVNFSYVKIPYSCKLLFQELMTMNIAPRLITN
tara:strand:- start:5731 stop:9288 length:3558 start_codon:yes stop_codon:yes gene_type:complete